MNNFPGSAVNVHFYVSDVIEGVAKEERENIRSFVEHVEEWAISNPVVLSEDVFNSVVLSFRVYDVNVLHGNFMKERSILCAMWVIYLRVYRMCLSPESSKMFKYKSMHEFLREYDQDFPSVRDEEVEHLFYTANWMALCLKIFPAKRNKGFFLHVIPKVIEGFHAKYVTGSGQSKSTSYRVLLFEREGNIKIKSKRKRESSDSGTSGIVFDGIPDVMSKYSDFNLSTLCGAYTHDSDDSEEEPQRLVRNESSSRENLDSLMQAHSQGEEDDEHLAI